MEQADILIVGGGVVALTIARELVGKGHKNILILEKESSVAQHASGRNSGVMHAGIYYAPDSLRAQFCLRGSLAMQAYCEANKLPVAHTGKVIVTRCESELPALEKLYHRAQKNGAKVDLIDEHELAKIEPHAKTVSKAIYSHYTAVVDSQKIMAHLASELLKTKKVRFAFDTQFVGLREKQVAKTTQGDIGFELLINAAGSYAEKIAQHFDIAQDLVMLPLKGIYKKLKPEYAHLVNGNIYPVPDDRNTFLGVHFTKNIHGDVYVGPTAIPAFGRENYGLISGIDSELLSILSKEAVLMLMDGQFRRSAFSEIRKYSRRCFFNDAKQLVKELHPHWLADTKKAGIRPQLVNWKTKSLVMDFMVEKAAHSVHVLNAISPAFTSSIAFAEHVVKEYVA